MTELQEQLEFTFGDPNEIMGLVYDQRLPKMPFATDNYELFGCRKEPRALALKRAYVQYNHENLVTKLVFDIDSNIAHLQHEGFRSIGLPEPTWWTFNTAENYGRAHVCYELLAPVPRTELARLKPLRFLAAIENGLMQAFIAENIDVDPQFAGLLCKNPRSGRYQVVTSGTVYDLADLAEWVDLKAPRPPRAQGLGRNCDLFDQLRFFAYGQKAQCSSHEQLQKAVAAKAEQVNKGFSPPLGASEVRSTVKSVAKWVWNRFNVAESNKRFQAYVDATHTPEIQRKRGRKGGYASGKARYDRTIEARNEARTLREQGLKLKEIAQRLGVTDRTIKNWLKN